MSSRPRRPAPFLSMRPAGRRPDAPTERTTHGLVITARTEVEAAHGALRDTLLDLGSPRFDAAADELVTTAGVLDRVYGR